MNVRNNSTQPADLRLGGAGNGGGPETWRTLGPGDVTYYELPPNSFWQVESRLSGSQLSSKTTARSDDDVQLVQSGARIRPQVVMHEPIAV